MARHWNTHTKPVHVESYTFDPADIVIKPDLNGRHDHPDLTELRQSIEENGQLEPVVVRSESGKPVLIMGFSRWQAICAINKGRKPADRMKIKAVFADVNERDGLILNYEENRRRNQTTPLDDGYLFARLEKRALTIPEIAARLHLEPTFIKRRLKLIAAEPEVQAAVASGRLKPTAAIKIAKLSSEVQREAVKGNGAVSSATVDAALGKAPKITVKAIRAAIVDELALDVEDGCAKVLRRLLAMIDGERSHDEMPGL